MTELSIFTRMNLWARGSVSLKIVVMGIIVLLLLIPVSMLESLIHERESTRNESITDIWRTWGDRQILAGPVLSIPVETATVQPNGTTLSSTEYLHIFPETLEIKGKLDPRIRYRSIYETVLYSSELDVKGSFEIPDIAKFNVRPENIRWEKAFVAVGISDMKGVKEKIEIDWNGQRLRMQPGIPSRDILKNGGVSVPLSIDPSQKVAFSLALKLNGSRLMAFLPFASEMKVDLKSEWTNPSFEGAFIPVSREVSAAGFSAGWKVLELNRNYGQAGMGDFVGGGTNWADQLLDGDKVSSVNTAGCFGLSLLMPVDQYQRSNRAAKYAVLFVILTFVTFFFFELLKKKYVHPLQYLIVGFAIVLFYLLLLSLAEYMLFDLAYLVASLVITSMVMLYAAAIFSNRRYGIMVGLILLSLYAYFYFLLQLQLYSLLFGSIGMVVILSVIMILTRNLHKEKADTALE